MYIACQEGHEPVARLLLKRGAAVNQATNMGNTPLLTACVNGHEPVARLLLECGAVVDHGLTKQHPFTEEIMALLSREEERERKAEEERERKAEQERKADCMATELIATEEAERRKECDNVANKKKKKKHGKNQKREPKQSASSSTPPQTERERERQRILREVIREGQAFEYASWCDISK